MIRLMRTVKDKNVKVSIIIISIISIILMHKIKSYHQDDNITNNQEIIEKEKLEKNISEADTNDSGARSNDTWTKIKDSKIPSDANKVLPNGITLGDFKGMMEIQRDLCKQEGMSDIETNKILEQLAKDFGTTLDEVNRVVISETPVIVDTPSVGETSNGGNSGSSSENSGGTSSETPSSGTSGGGSSSSGNSGGTYVPPAEPSGGIVSPHFDGLGLDGIGSSEDNLDFNLEEN